MKSYQVMIEGVFVHAPELIGEAGGFHATFFLLANNARNAVNYARRMLLTRIEDHNIREVDRGPFSTYYLVRDIWEISGERFSENHGKDHGFTFFRIRGFEKIRLFLSKVFLKRFRPWLFIDGVRRRDGLG